MPPGSNKRGVDDNRTGCFMAIIQILVKVTGVDDLSLFFAGFYFVGNESDWSTLHHDENFSI